MNLSFSGKTVIITGASAGVGAACARAFAAHNANLVLVARGRAGLNAIAKELRQQTEVLTVAMDVADTGQCLKLLNKAEAKFGSVDVLINNAGGAPPADSSSVSERFTRSVIDLNLVAPIVFAQAASNLMHKSIGKGVIINISSVSGMRANPLGVAYGAAKAGVINATETLALEWGPAIRVLSISAGLVLTEESRSFYGDDTSVAKIASTLPMQRLGQPQDIANACLFAASDKASWMSGSNIVLHGGGDKPTYLDATEIIKD